MIHPDAIPLTTIVVEFKLTNANAGRGGSFWKSAKDRKDFESQLRAEGLVFKPIPHPVQLRVTRLLGPRERYWDPDSCGRGNFKEFCDAAVVCGWFHDDCGEWIRGVYFEQEKTDRKTSAVRIEIFDATART